MKYLYAVGLALLFCVIAKANNYYVSNTADSGPGSLREAIHLANANPGEDDVRLVIPGVGPHTIHLQSNLPPLASYTRILGSTQFGFAFPDEDTPTQIKVAIDGSAIGAGSTGFTTGSYCLVNGLAIYGFDTGIHVTGIFSHVYACHIGLDVTGTVAYGNNIDHIIITGYSNTIGGGVGGRNVIAGAANGIIIFPNTARNRVIANYIGTDVTGNNTIPGNGFDGISISSDENLVSDNVIVGYGSNNVLISQWAEDAPIPTENQVINNRIGHHADGSFSSFNNNCQGISINNASQTSVVSNTIYGNGCHGVLIDGTEATSNLISLNSIYGNAGIGINLGLDGVTANDLGDSDTGPNHLQNYPVLAEAKAQPFSTKVKAYIDTPDPETVRIEFYANPVPHSSGYGSGETYIGFAKPKSNGSIIAKLAPVASGTYISAIAIDSENNTSEFSLSIEATSPGNSSNAIGSINPMSTSMIQQEGEVEVSAYPNPFITETTIAYQLPECQKVKLSVFDATGQLVQVLSDDVQDAGIYQVQFNASHLPAGAYSYQLLTNGEVRTGKLISK